MGYGSSASLWNISTLRSALWPLGASSERLLKVTRASTYFRDKLQRPMVSDNKYNRAIRGCGEDDCP